MKANAINIKNLTKIYSSGVVALNDLNLIVKDGDFFALLGSNGAGKSTTIGILTSLLFKTSGKVYIFEYNIDIDHALIKSFIGVVPQEFNFNQFETPLEIIISQAGYYGIGRKCAAYRAEYYLKRLDLWDKKNVISRSLSGGMKRRLMIARALIHEPRILILDEPTAGVDVGLRKSMWELLQELNNSGVTIILTTHYLEEVEQLCNKLAIIDNGKIIEKIIVKDLFKEKTIQTIIFESIDVVDHLPKIKNCKLTKLDSHTIEVIISGSYTMNNLFNEFSNADILISNVRHKSNRLEDFFVNKINNNTKKDII